MVNQSGNKYKNNYNYNLAIHLLNNKPYMTNGSLLIVENPAPFSPISELHFQYYGDAETNSAQVLKKLEEQLQHNDSIQCIVGKELPFGTAQCPTLTDFADGVDTMAFLKNLAVNEG